MEIRVKDLTISLEQETPFVRLTVGNRACASAALLDGDDLEKLGRAFLSEARKLQGDKPWQF